MKTNLQKLLLAVLATCALASCGEESSKNEQQSSQISSSEKQLAELPEPFDSSKEGAATFSVSASNITAANFDDFANRAGIRYIDLRNAENYYASRLEGFEMIEFFAKIYDGSSDHSGTQLFYKDANGIFQPRYTDSVDILRDLFPQDQTLFLMCQSGGRVAVCMQILQQYGWDMSKIYNIGGMNQYTESKFKIDFSIESLKPLETKEYGTKATESKKLNKDLPDPFDSAKEGASTFNLTASNITSANLDQYYDLDGVRYIDLRDAGKYTESRLEQFEMVQFFANIYSETAGTQLFYKDSGTGKYVARYAESVKILETMLPKDETLFLMCQSGARVAVCMQIMEQFGWDMANVYNVGGMNQYASSKYRMDLNLADLTTNTSVLKKGVFTEQSGKYSYTMTAYVSTDEQGKITAAYAVGGYTDASMWKGAENWISGKDAFLTKLVGKTKAEVEALIDAEDKVTDKVAGSTLSSRRAIKAVINALTEQAAAGE